MLSDRKIVSNLRGVAPEQNMPAAVTDIGCEREINEDRYAVIDSPGGRAWIVCDGMGGTLGGELAAQLAIDAIRRKLESSDSGSAENLLIGAIEEANRVILLRRQNPAFSGMGTTVVGTLINRDELVITHAGDSRAYLVRDGNIQQLTTDHTYVQDLVERGAIKQHEALSHPQAHVLTRCLGAEPRLALDTQKYWIWDLDKGEAQDKLLLCSDGLYSLVDDDEIAEIVTSASPQEGCVKLIELAKARGGYDNITVTILPLNGQLKEERPIAKEKKAIKADARRKQARRRKSRLSARQKVILGVILIVFGSAMGLILALFKQLQG